MTRPDAKQIARVIDATWPAAVKTQVGPWIIREGQGGGSRVSAATATGALNEADVTIAADAMRALGQTPIFMIRPGDDGLDDVLARHGYAQKDPTNMYAAAIATVATQRPPPITSFETWPPLAVQADIWAAGGIGPERLAVMERAPHPKITLLGRADDRPAGTVFASIAEDCAMIHALEVVTAHRRKGLARQLTRAVAFWAQAQGAAHLTLLTTQANAGANALYSSLGMSVVGQYHYRTLPE